jgi:hypothetical protein
MFRSARVAGFADKGIAILELEVRTPSARRIGKRETGRCGGTKEMPVLFLFSLRR